MDTATSTPDSPTTLRMYIRGVPDDALANQGQELKSRFDNFGKILSIDPLNRFHAAHFDFLGTKDQIQKFIKTFNGTRWAGNSLHLALARQRYTEFYNNEKKSTEVSLQNKRSAASALRKHILEAQLAHLDERVAFVSEKVKNARIFAEHIKFPSDEELFHDKSETQTASKKYEDLSWWAVEDDTISSSGDKFDQHNIDVFAINKYHEKIVKMDKEGGKYSSSVVEDKLNVKEMPKHKTQEKSKALLDYTIQFFGTQDILGISPQKTLSSGVQDDIDASQSSDSDQNDCNSQALLSTDSSTDSRANENEIIENQVHQNIQDYTLQLFGEYENRDFPHKKDKTQKKAFFEQSFTQQVQERKRRKTNTFDNSIKDSQTKPHEKLLINLTHEKKIAKRILERMFG